MADDGQRKNERVLIAGAGIAGIEAALALRDLAGDLVDVRLFDSRREFAYRPFAVADPYGATRAFRYSLEQLSGHCDASFVPSGIAAIEAEERIALSDEGERINYDHLVVATGSQARLAVPGAVTFWGSVDESQVGDVFADLRAGALGRVVFTRPSGYSWVLPLYELALRAVAEISQDDGVRAEIAVVTPERTPLEVFGERVGHEVRDLLDEHGIEVISATSPARFEPGRLLFEEGGETGADAVVALPRCEGRRLSGIPHDGEGFVRVDAYGRAIGLENVYAAGDATDFPFKQGGISSQQADAVAEAIAAAAGASIDPHPLDPVLRGILWTGRQGPRYFYGRPPGERQGASNFSEHPQGPLSNGKITAHYFSPLVDSLSA